MRVLQHSFRNPLPHHIRWGLALIFLLILLMPTSFGYAASGQIVVNTFEDTKANDGHCSLREAIIAANRDRHSGSKPNECPAGHEADTIVLPAGTYILNRTDSGNEDSARTGDLDIRDDVSIIGGPGTSIGGDNLHDRILHILNGHVTISDVTIRDGNVFGNGGAIFNRGTLTLINVTISGNLASENGGGIYNKGMLTLHNSTIAYNSAAFAGGGVFNNGGIVNIKNTLIAANAATSAPDCSGPLASDGHNFIQNSTNCNISGDLTGNLLNQDPLLDALEPSNNGTEIHALLPGSPAIDAGDTTDCPATDQRGEPRPLDGDGDGVPSCDIGAYEALPTPVSLISTHYPNTSGGITIVGRLNFTPDTEFILNFYTDQVCSQTVSGSPLFSTPVSTDSAGNAYFIADGPAVDEDDLFATATATDPDGHISQASSCITIGPNNIAWPYARRLQPNASFEQHIDQLGQSRWFKFAVEPSSRVTVTLTNLPANYDLTLYNDIEAVYNDLIAPQNLEDLNQLGAEFAPNAFAPDAYAPNAFAPNAFAPNAFAPNAFAPNAFAPNAFAPNAFAPNAFAADAYAPDAYAPDAFAPNAFAPNAFAPNAFAPNAFAPNAFAPNAFADAQMRSLVGVSAFEGTSGEGIALNTWNNSGDMFIRVKGRNGAFSLEAPFFLEVRMTTGTCSTVDPLLDTAPLPPVGNPTTLILTDEARMLNRMPEGDTGARAQLETNLNALAAPADVIRLNVDDDPRVRNANSEADARPECPYAKNLVAQAIKDIVDGYATQDNSNLQNVVIIGSDEIIPFFRYPDQALLGNEFDYQPPVADPTSSQASLRLSYILGQDEYGSQVNILRGNSVIPVPNQAVGRLAESAADINAVIEAYLDSGGVIEPQTSLVTGYDFLEDTAIAVRNELADGISAAPDELITPNNLSPTDPDPRVWTADQLRAQLFGSRHDIVFLAGHFSANSALAADYSSQMSASEIIETALDQPELFRNVLVYSAGCHAGYNIVDEHGIEGVTRQPDWSAAFARRGATLISGTGYQYGDTDFIEYSERLYLEFTRQLRRDTGGPIPIGQAMVAAKQAYLAEIVNPNGLHIKSLLEATIFGLPMLSVDMEVRSEPPPDEPSISPVAVASDPGQMLGLAYADISVFPSLNEQPFELVSVDDGSSVMASYLTGSDGRTVTNPAEPVLPLEVLNAAAADYVPETALRGVGFRGGSYVDTPDVVPVTGAPTTEIRGVHVPFVSDVFFPIQLWQINYFDALAGGSTQLMVTPVQHVSSEPGSLTNIRRAFSSTDFRLYYSGNTETYTDNNGVDSTPALAAPPSIVHVSDTTGPGSVTFQINVVGNPAAGIQEVWVTYTDVSAPFPRRWDSIYLTQAANSTLWEGTLNLNGTNPQDIRYMVQAVNGVGLVSLATNLGAYYIPGLSPGPTAPTSLTFEPPTPTAGPYGAKATFSVRLSSGETDLAGQSVLFRLGPQTRLALTDDQGLATATLSLLGVPGQQVVQAIFKGTANYDASLTSSPFTLNRQVTILTLDPASASVFPGQPTGIVATLKEPEETGRRLVEKTVFFVITGENGNHVEAVITDYAGRATLGVVPLPGGTYTVNAYFSGNIPIAYPAPNPPLFDSRYFASDTVGQPGTLTIINLPPVAVDDEATTDEDVPVYIDVLDNDSDPEENPLSIIIFDATSVEGGSVDCAEGVEGQCLYTPPANYYGSDSFTYYANDGQLNSEDPATVTITINSINDAGPVTVDDAYAVDEDGSLSIDAASGVLANDTDVDNDPLTAILVDDSGPSNGTLTFNSDGSFTYEPAPNFNGQDSFSYRANDGFVDSDPPATVTITVNPVNDSPVAADDEASTFSHLALTIDVLANDTDLDGDTLQVDSVTDGENGTVTNNGINVTYTPNSGFAGPDSFTYVVSDGNGGTDTATVYVTVIQAVCSNVLDDFNREDTKLGSNWGGSTSEGNYRLVNNAEVEVMSGGDAYWNVAAFGPDQEACITLKRVDNNGHQTVILKVQSDDDDDDHPEWEEGVIAVFYNTEGSNMVGVETYIPDEGWNTLGTWSMDLQDGDQLAGVALADGTIEAYVNGVLIGSVNSPFFAEKGGHIGIWFIGNQHAILDDFAGR